MACHPSSVCVDIIGIAASDRGRTCKKHKVSASVVAKDIVVRFRTVQVEKGVHKDKAQEEETVIAVYHVMGGVDTCQVGFLCRHLVKYADK